MIKDVPSNVDVQLALAPQSVAAGASVNGPAIDVQQYDGRILFVCEMGAVGEAGTFKVQHDDNNGFTSPTDLSGATASHTATDDNSVLTIAVDLESLPSGERYLRLVYTNGGATNANLVGGSVALGLKRRR